MSLYETWVRTAYDRASKPIKAFWKEYLPREQAVYEKLIGNKENSIKGTIKELAELYNMKEFEACGFIDGIGGALNEELDMEEMDENTLIDVSFEFENLFNKMVEYKAEHLYTLPEWSGIFDEAAQKEMVRVQKASGTVVKDKKIGRNDPCPCGSGKKYKKCCGMNENAV